MRATENDTEITLGTGRMLALFFGIVLVCAVFFAIGFSLGRKSSMVGIASSAGSSPGSATLAGRSPGDKDIGSKAAPAAASAVPADSGKTAAGPASSSTVQAQAAEPAASAPNHPSAPTGGTPAAAGGYVVQVAAVTREEDADALVEALKKKQYAAFSTKSSAADRFYHVQVGPYGEFKDADAMRKRLMADGYNPILKK